MNTMRCVTGRSYQSTWRFSNTGLQWKADGFSQCLPQSEEVSTRRPWPAGLQYVWPHWPSEEVISRHQGAAGGIHLAKRLHLLQSESYFRSRKPWGYVGCHGSQEVHVTHRRYATRVGMGQKEHFQQQFIHRRLRGWIGLKSCSLTSWLRFLTLDNYTRVTVICTLMAILFYYDKNIAHWLELTNVNMKIHKKYPVVAKNELSWSKSFLCFFSS